MINADDIQDMEKLLEKARVKAGRLAPEVELIELGEYEVWGTIKPYRIQIGEDDFGQLWLACVCRGGLEGKACYHGVRAWDMHKALLQASDKPTPDDPAEMPYLDTKEQKNEVVGKVRI